jgi:hypothetical protein
VQWSTTAARRSCPFEMDSSAAVVRNLGGIMPPSTWLDTIRSMATPVDFRLGQIKFVAGTSPGREPAQLDPGPVTVFVGPNNSGKSLALMEIHSWANQQVEPPQPWPGGRVVATIEGHWPADEDALNQFLAPVDIAVENPDPNPQSRRVLSFSLDQGIPGGSAGGLFIRRFQGGDFMEYCRTKILPAFTARLDGRSRFGLSEPRQLSTLREPPSSHLMAILRDGDLYRRVDNEIHAAFGYHFVIDMSQPPNLSPALTTEEPPPGDWHERIDEEAIGYQKRAVPITEFSDGVKVYAGLVSAVESLPHILLLVDEPEAFLHPLLARRLGGLLARTARARAANLVVATHSAEFVMGCMAEVPETDIVRLTYEQSIATARPLAGADVARLVRDPLLRSADALGALFARAAVVCEADADRALYDEINRRLTTTPGRVGADDTLFLNAQNWQTIPRIAAPLRRLGIPAAVILDLDALTEDAIWGEYIKFATPVVEEQKDLHVERRGAGEVLLSMGSLGSGDRAVLKCKAEGIEGIEEDSGRAAVRSAIARLGEYGIFIVPVGELERWLPSLGVTNKRTWVTEVLRRLGARGDPVYVEPGEGDVWEFVETLARWLNTPDRKGMT